MKTRHLFWMLFALVLLGVWFGYFIAPKRPLPFLAETSAPENAPRARKINEGAKLDFPKPMATAPVVEEIRYPTNAIPGELVLHFDQRSDYLAYLEALNAAGLSPLGQIDELLAIRIPEEARLKANYGEYGVRAGFSYRIERPAPPIEVAPEALARLQAFGNSARSITQGEIAGSGEGVIVALLDSGIQAHPQFDDVSIVQMDLIGSGVTGSGAAHGTSVASIVTGKEGIASAAELLAVRVIDDVGAGNSYHVAQGIVQAVDYGAKVINMSLGAYQDMPLLREAVAYAHQRGVLMVAAAGNDGFDSLPYPAAYPEVLAVTAVDGRGQHAFFANQSEQIDFAAPGVGVLTAKEETGTILFSGTSSAAPFVSGTLASLISGEGALPPRQAVELLKRYLNDQGAPGVDPHYGAGVLDWDRLHERATPNLLDVALADIYLPANAQPGTTRPIEITVQNRGTRWFSRAQLEVFVGETEPTRFTLGSLEPGQITTRKVFAPLPARNGEVVLDIAARVMPEKMIQDIRLENNVKVVTFQPTQ